MCIRCYMVLALVAVSVSGLMASIQKEQQPVRVTHSNSGPTYDIENEVERVRSPSEEPIAVPTGEREEPNNNKKPSDDDMPAMGHVTIRRIFLVPLMPPAGSSSDDESSPDQSRPFMRFPSSSDDAPMRPSTANLWPGFLFPRGPPSDDTSSDNKPMASSPSADRDRDAPMEQPRPMIDPMQLLRDIIEGAHAISMMRGLGESPMMPPFVPSAGAADSEPDNKSLAGTELEKAGSNAPASRNETKEEVVEIEGKKYMKKTIINRHVGENIVFMTRRLIFTPLNETESTTPAAADQSNPTTTTTTTVAPVSSTEPVRKVDEATSGTTVAAKEADQPTTVSSTSTVAPVTEPTSTTAVPDVTASPSAKESWVEKVAEAVERSAEKLAQNIGSRVSSTTSTTTEAPVTTVRA